LQRPTFYFYFGVSLCCFNGVSTSMASTSD